MLIYFLLIILNSLSEYLIYKMMIATAVLDKKNDLYHAVCAGLRIIWVLAGTCTKVPVPGFLIGLFVLFFLNVIPYRRKIILMNNFTMIIYLMFTTLLLIITGIAGLAGFDFIYSSQNTSVRVVIMTAAFMSFNALCIFLYYFHPDYLWREDYDKSKVLIYTHFLFVCAVYHILDAVILYLYQADRIGYLLLLSGDVLIFILIFNFLNYNYVFEKSEEMQREYEQSEIMLAQQYFEKDSLKKLSEFDSLTNAYNRREISSLMLQYIQSGHQLICVFADLDGLKHINDTYGHTFGDFLLKRFADACDKILHDKGHLARIGGDEFLLVFPDQKRCDIEECIKELQLILLKPADDKEKIYFSYGISSEEESVEDYILLADQRMYTDKNRKRRDTK